MKSAVLSFVSCLFLVALWTVSEVVAAQWTRVDEIPEVDVIDLHVDGQSLYVASLDKVYIRSLGSSAFELSGSPDSGVGIWKLAHAGDRLLAGTFGAGVYESLDSGRTWVSRSSGLSGVPARTVSCFTVRGDSVYLGTSGVGVYVSPLGGTLSWQPFRDSLPWNVAWEIYSLHNHDNILFTGAGLSGSVFRNYSGQSYWEEFAVGPFIPTGLAALGLGAFENMLIAAASNGVYTSVDSGATWTHYQAPFLAGAEGCVIEMPGRVMAMLCHISQGTYVWEWKGGTWEVFDYQPGFPAYTMAYFDGRLYAATWYGLWYLPLDPTDTDPEDPLLPDRPTLAQNYPNPFNPATTIGYSLPSRSHVVVDVFNLLGQTVRTLIDADQALGSYVIEWDGTDDSGDAVATGVYLYRLKTDYQTESRKMLLIR